MPRFLFATLRNFCTLLVQTAVHKLSAVYLKVVITALQVSYTYTYVGVIYSSSVKPVSNKQLSYVESFLSMLHVLNFWYLRLDLSTNVTLLRGRGGAITAITARYVGGAITAAVVIFRDLLEMCWKHICGRIVINV